MFSSDLLLRESAQCPDSDEAKFQALVLLTSATYYDLPNPSPNPNPNPNSSPCPNATQDVNRHQFFNTNNLWIDLEALKVLPPNNPDLEPIPNPNPSPSPNPKQI